MQVGSQRVSSIAYAEAKKFYKAGEIGQLNCIEASFDRHTTMGAWQYTMPLDANENTIAWKKYLKINPDTPFDAKRFFWWRNYKEYGTGVAGDLFVHLLSGIHFLTDSKGPSRIFATGDLIKPGKQDVRCKLCIPSLPSSHQEHCGHPSSNSNHP